LEAARRRIEVEIKRPGHDEAEQCAGERDHARRGRLPFRAEEKHKHAGKERDPDGERQERV
jgi:hypothetical protein